MPRGRTLKAREVQTRWDSTVYLSGDQHLLICSVTSVKRPVTVPALNAQRQAPALTWNNDGVPSTTSSPSRSR
jgi:hypothetical protein